MMARMDSAGPVLLELMRGWIHLTNKSKLYTAT